MEAKRLWSRPTEWPSLSSDDVHVWRIRLDVPESRVQVLGALLSGREREEVERREKGRNQRRFIVAHGALRSILADYEGIEAPLLRLKRRPGGKPYMAVGATASSLFFNLSHSHERALCVVALCRAVGVDVERIRRVAAMEEITRRYFSQEEALAWRALPGEQKLNSFLATWTRKEACGKALGEGVSRRWQRLAVSLDHGAGATSLEVQTHGGTWTDLQVRDVDVGSGYLAAVAAEGPGWHLRCWQWG